MAHCGPTSEEFYLRTAPAVDVATGWVEIDVVWHHIAIARVAKFEP